MASETEGAPSPGEELPHKVRRDKRGRACHNCRRAKIRCMRSADKDRCARCEKRNELCVLIDRTYDAGWHEQVASDLHAGLEHVGKLSSAVAQIARHLSLDVFDEGFEIPPLRQGSIASPPPSGPGVEKRRRKSERPQEQSDNEGIDLFNIPDLLFTPAYLSPTESRQVDFLGCHDPRPNIIKKGLIVANDAKHLFTFFNQHLSPFLFGYDPKTIPYHPGGLTHITPFVLSAACFVAAERCQGYGGLAPAMSQEVHRLLLHSPTESIMGISAEGEDEWDPEMGIGPEEVVGAAYLALFSSDRVRTSGIARLAHQWADGLIKWTKTVKHHQTIGEAIGVLPAPRPISPGDMSRFWLLSYVVQGMTDIQSYCPMGAYPDPEYHCTQLSTTSIDQGDASLVQHARLFKVLGDWYSQWATSDAAGRAKIARSTNAALNAWMSKFEAAMLRPEARHLLQVLYVFAKMTTHAYFARSTNAQRAGPEWSLAVDGAMELITLFGGFTAERLYCLPPSYFSMLNQAVEILIEARRGSASFWAFSATSALERIAVALEESPLPPGHVGRNTAKGLRDGCAHLRGPVGT